MNSGTLSARAGRALGLLVLIVAAIVALAPLLWTLSTSLRTPAEAFTDPPAWIPLHPDWDNYAAVFEQLPLLTFFMNSVIVTGLIVAAQTVTCMMSGYAFAMIRFPGRAATFMLFLATMMVPLQATIIPVFVLIKWMGLANSLGSLIVPALGGAFGTFLMRQYFMQMPKELGEAARIDGASRLQVFWLIYARMAMPPAAALATLNFSGFWSEFYRPLIFLSDQDTYTLPLGLVELQGNLGTGSVSVVLAGVVVALVPSILLFSFAQRYFIEGITTGSFR